MKLNPCKWDKSIFSKKKKKKIKGRGMGINDPVGDSDWESKRYSAEHHVSIKPTNKHIEN